jgi:hypothetical protein
MKLDPRSIERLVKLLGMLGSNHDGERAAAALKANALVREHGLVWSDVIPAAPEQSSSSYRQEHARRWEHDAAGADQTVDWHIMRGFCAQHSNLLRSREQEFIDDIAGWRGALTEKQNAWLIAIYTRVKKLA